MGISSQRRERVRLDCLAPSLCPMIMLVVVFSCLPVFIISIISVGIDSGMLS